MRLSEPTTLLTDYLLGACAAVWALRLGSAARRRRQRSVALWAGALGAVAAAAFAGGTFHGFLLHLGPTASRLLWKATLYAIGATGLLLLAAVAEASLAGGLRRGLLAATGAKFLLYAAWMLDHDDFRYAVWDYGVSLLAALGLQAAAWLRSRAASAPWIAGGIAASLLAAAVQRSGLDLHRHFNHNDLYHLLQIGALYLLYRGGALLEDRGEEAGAAP